MAQKPVAWSVGEGGVVSRLPDTTPDLEKNLEDCHERLHSRQTHDGRTGRQMEDVVSRTLGRLLIATRLPLHRSLP